MCHQYTTSAKARHATGKSHLPDLNRRPLPYHGSALPTELRWQQLQYNILAGKEKTANIAKEFLVIHTALSGILNMV